MGDPDGALDTVLKQLAKTEEVKIGDDQRYEGTMKYDRPAGPSDRYIWRYAQPSDGETLGAVGGLF